MELGKGAEIPISQLTWVIRPKFTSPLLGLCQFLHPHEKEYYKEGQPSHSASVYLSVLS